jgi:hypothetical protein
VIDTAKLPNSPEALAPLVGEGRIPMRRVWGMLALRSALSFGLLLLAAFALGLAGRNEAVAASAAWWLWFVTAANVLCIVLMVRFSRLEGMRLRDVFFASRSTWKGDLVWLLVGLVGAAVLAQVPGTLLAEALWGDASYPNPMLFQRIPLWAVYPLFLLMPTTQAFAELPIYFGYVAPRLRASGMGRWLVIGVVGAVLSVQHMFFAFQLDWRYDLWLAVKFLPFALWMGFIVDRRPTALPYLMVVHFALDSALPVIVLMAAQGMPLS